MSHASSRSASSGERRGRYRMSDHGKLDDGTYRGNMFCTNRVQPMKLAWTNKRGEDATTAVRICPNLNPDYGEVEGASYWDPFKLDDEEFGDWIRVYWTARGVGEDPVTFLIYDPQAPGNQHRGKEFVMRETPMGLLYSGLNNAIDNREERTGWAGLLKGRDGESAVIQKPKQCGFIQGPIFQRGKILETPLGTAPDDLMPLLDLGADACRRLLRYMGKEKPIDDQNDDPDNPFAHLLVGRDPIAWKKGVFFNFFPVGHDPRKSGDDDREDSGPARRRGIGVGQRRGDSDRDKGDKDERIGFDLFHSETFRYSRKDEVEATFDKAAQDLLAEKVVPWDDVFVFHELQKQAEILQPRVPFSLQEYCWADFPDWIPSKDSDIARKGREAVSSGYGGRGGGSRRRDDDDDDRRGRGRGRDDDRDDRRRDDDDDDRPRGRARDDDGDDPKPRGGRDLSRAARDDDGDDAPPSRRQPAEDDDPKPRGGGRRVADDDDSDDPRPGRKTPSEPEDDAPKPRSRAKAEDDGDDDPRPGRREPAAQDEPAPRSRRQPAEIEDDPPSRRGKTDAAVPDEASGEGSGGSALSRLRAARNAAKK